MPSLLLWAPYSFRERKYCYPEASSPSLDLLLNEGDVLFSACVNLIFAFAGNCMHHTSSAVGFE
jgi:hypothetical protein